MSEGHSRGHIVVFGFRGVARRIVHQLTAAGQDVVVVEADPSAAELATMSRYGAQFVESYRQTQETLDDAQVGQARAVVCAFNDDVQNIEVALLVRKRSPGARIVIQMANPAVGRALTGVATPGAVLQVAELAAPSFVEATINRTTHELDIDGHRFIVATHASEVSGTFRQLWGDLAPIAISGPDGTQARACPRRDDEVRVGDEVTLMGSPADFAAAGLTPLIVTGSRTGRSLRVRLREGISATINLLDTPLRIVVALLGALAALSFVFLLIGYREPDGTRMSGLDAVYFTAETIATVGFGDFYFRDQDDWLRIWAIVIILLGATLIAVATALLTNALVSRSLAQSIGRQRVTGMRGHIVLVGLGSVGSRVASELHDAGYEVAVIDSGEGQRFVPQMRSLGIPVLIGDATLAQTLDAAQVGRAQGVVIVTSDDLINIEVGLAAHDVLHGRDIPVVLRIFGRTVARELGDYVDAGTPRSIAELSAPWFVGAALGLDVLGTFYVGSSPFMAARVTITAGGPLDGTTVDRLGDRMRVVAIERLGAHGSLEYPPRRTTQLHGGDMAYLVGHHEVLFDVLQRA